MNELPRLQAEVQRALNEHGLAIEHYFLNGIVACEWSPQTRGCVLCRWHRLDVVVPL